MEFFISRETILEGIQKTLGIVEKIHSGVIGEAHTLHCSPKIYRAAECHPGAVAEPAEFQS